MAWPTTPLVVEVSLAPYADVTIDDPLTWSWVDITSKTFDRDGDSSIVITRGRQDESAQSPPSSIDLTVNNSDGRFSPRNPVGVYYPDLTRNAPIRIRVNPGTGLSTRGIGFISEFPSRWDVAEADFHVPVRADGVLRRLGQGATPLKSVLRKVLGASSPRAYWPLEDGASATQAASGLGNGRPMSLFGSVTFAANTDVLGSAPLPDFSGGGSLSAAVTGGSSTAWSVEFSGVLVDGFYVPFAWNSKGSTLVDWNFAVLAATDVRIFAYQADGTQLTPITVVPTGTFTDPHNWVITATQNGTGVDVQLFQDGTLVDTGTLTTQTLGAITQVRVNPGGSGAISLGHITVYDGASQTGHYEAMTGYAGELAGTRFIRLCDEESVPVNVPNAGFTEPMGAQTSPKNLLDLLRECEAAEEGLIVERLTGKLGLDARSTRENQPVGLILNYAAKQITPPLEPTDDDQLTRNDVTVTRTGGSSARVVDEDGPLGVTAVGRYDESVTLNLFDDDQPLQHAGWRVNLGTVDGLRFPTITVNLRANPSLVAAWLALDISDRIRITNLPNHISYDDLDLIVEGYTEQISQKNWIITFNCAPYRPYQVGVLAEDSMTLLTAEDTTSTAWRVAAVPQLADLAADLPYDLRVDGEVVTVTAVTAIEPTFTQGTPAHADNAAVTPANPSHAEGDLLVTFAAIRSSGVGIVAISAGWTLLEIGGASHCRAWGKYATSAAETDPTVTPSGGSAGDTVSAVVVRMRACQLTPAKAVGQLNGSAQDIATPLILVPREGDYQAMLFCWKQDDVTGVAAPASFANEMVEASTITGNDQVLYIARQAATVPAAHAPVDTAVVTGGAAAISRAHAVLFHRGVADITVTRSVNGVVTSHAQLATVQVDLPMNLAL